MAAQQGCIMDDLSRCPSVDNLTVKFRMEAGASDGTDVARRLSSVDVLLYDAEGRFVEHKRIERSDLTLFPGAHFTVEPGEYRVLAWANSASGSRFSTLISGESLMEQGYIEMTGAGDSLYYAPAKVNPYRATLQMDEITETITDDSYALYGVNVPKGGGEAVKEVSFTRAYRSINFYLKGLEYLPGAQAGQTQAEAHNLSTRYDLLFNTKSERRDEIRTFSAALTPDGTLPSARFYSAYGPIEEDISFSISNLPGEVEPMLVMLWERLAENPPPSFDDIDILIEFFRSGDGRIQVSITLPDWSERPVAPEY
jgi:hypothetical protein